MNKTITLTQEQTNDIIDFIDDELEARWDRYTDWYLCDDSLEDGKRRMGSSLYDMMISLRTTAPASNEEVQDIVCVVNDILYDAWTGDRRRSSKETSDEGMRQMNPEIFDLIVALQKELDQE